MKREAIIKIQGNARSVAVLQVFCPWDIFSKKEGILLGKGKLNSSLNRFKTDMRVNKGNIGNKYKYL